MSRIIIERSKMGELMFIVSYEIIDACGMQFMKVEWNEL